MATMIRQIDAEIENLQYEFITPTKILVKGEIAKQIFFVSNLDVVRHQSVRTPFTVSFEVVGLHPGTPIMVDAQIEHISPRLINQGTQVEESIIMQITVTPTFGGMGVSQQFLVRNVDTLEEPRPTAKSTPLAPAALLHQAPPPLPDNEVAAAPVLDRSLEEKLRQLEDQLRFEIERSLRWELRSQMEYELERRLAEEHRRQEEAAQRAEWERQAAIARRHQEIHRESIRQSLYGFKTKY